MCTPKLRDLSPHFKTSKCHSNWGGGNGLTNQNPPCPIPSHMLLAWYSGTEVVTSGPSYQLKNRKYMYYNIISLWILVCIFNIFFAMQKILIFQCSKKVLKMRVPVFKRMLHRRWATFYHCLLYRQTRVPYLLLNKVPKRN
jgi:hypothetical protein